jgi:hypothetical protein
MRETGVCDADFHVGNTGSNPVGDAKKIKDFSAYGCFGGVLTATGPEFTRKLTPGQLPDGISAAA